VTVTSIVVADAGNHRLVGLAPGFSSTPYAPLWTLGTEGGLINTPSAVVHSFASDKVWVADTGLNSVKLIQPPSSIANGNSTALGSWSGILTQAAAGNLEGTLSYVSVSTVHKFRELIGRTGIAQFSSWVNDIGSTPTEMSNDGETDVYKFTYTVNGTDITFFITFVNEDGTWKLLDL
jgi:hypothetical protein